jgi:hypothetical protein
MRRDEYLPHVSDPEAEGLPDTADDDSTAGDDIATGRQADGPDPAQLPSDEPLAVDHYGNTAQEQLDGESLDQKIAREQWDRPVDDPLSNPVDPALSGEADGEAAAAQARFDDDVLNPGPTSDPSSPVSIYDHDNLGTVTGTTVGRLVESDATETDSIGYDAGPAGRGASAEELAVRETPPPE